MTRHRYQLLTWIAFHWRWGWVHLVTMPERLMWANISAAMTAKSLHIRQWAAEGPDLPAWVPCQRCEGDPCCWVGDDASADPALVTYLDYLAGLGDRTRQPPLH